MLTQIYKTLTILFLIIPIFLTAQENQNPYEIDTIFVTASRVEEPINRIPLSVYLITEEAIRLRNYGDISSILYSSPGIDIRAYSVIGGATSISLFGSSSQQVLVLLDGRPLNSPSLGVADLGFVPTNNLKKIEIVNGPTSSLYGANALGGVVNFVTKSPLDFPDRGAYYDASFLYGSYHTNRIYLGAGISSGDFGFLLNANQENSQGYRTNDICLKQGVKLKVGYHNQRNRLGLEFGYETKELGSPGPKPLPESIPKYGDSTASSIYDRTADTSYFIRVDLDLKLNPQFSLEFIPSFSKNQTQFLWVDQWSQDTALYLYRDRYETKVIGSNLLANYQFLSWFRLNGGIDFKQDEFLAHLSLDTTWQAKAHRFGIFCESNIGIGSFANIIPAQRFDWNSDFGNFFSPSLGFLFPIIPQIRIRMHIGRAFRAPNFNDLYWPKLRNPNIDIKPGYGDAFQFGVDWKVKENLTFALTTFVRKTKGLISWIPDTAGIWQPTIIDKSEIIGIAINGKVKWFKGFSFRYSLNLSKANQTRKEMVYSDWTTGETQFEQKRRRAAYLPEFTSTQEISYQTDFGTNVALEIRETGTRVNYYTSYDSSPKIYMITKSFPFNYILNFRAKQRLLAGADLIFRIENLLNQNYAEQFGNSPYDLDYPRPKLTIFSELRISNF